MPESGTVSIWHQPSLVFPLPQEDGKDGRWVLIPEICLLPGHITVITGESGTGKSLLLGLLSETMALPGSLSASPRTMPSDLRQRQAKIQAAVACLRRFPKPYAWIPQHLQFRDHLTVQEEWRHQWFMAGLPFPDQEVVDQRFQAFRLFEAKNRKIRYLSGGERKRLVLLIRMPPECPLVVMDEPEAGLDEGTFLEVMGSVLRAAGSHPPAIVMVTHHPGWVASVALTSGWPARRVAEIHTCPEPEATVALCVSHHPQGSKTTSIADISLDRRMYEGISAAFENEYGHPLPYATLCLVALTMITATVACTWGRTNGLLVPERTIFFVTCALLWISLQNGVVITLRHIPLMREDSLWSNRTSTASAVTCGIGSSIRSWSLLVMLTVPSLFLGLLFGVALLSTTNFVFHKETRQIGGVTLLFGGLTALGCYGHVLGSMLAQIAVVFQRIPSIRRGLDTTMIAVLAPLVVLPHVLLSATYLEGSGNRSWEFTGRDWAHVLPYFNPCFLVAQCAEGLLENGIRSSGIIADVTAFIRECWPFLTGIVALAIATILFVPFVALNGRQQR